LRAFRVRVRGRVRGWGWGWGQGWAARVRVRVAGCAPASHRASADRRAPPATVGAQGCNRRCPRLQPRVPKAVTVRAAGCRVRLRLRVQGRRLGLGT
jgi:hypothetical protein